ncbi:hypothetical protein OAQ12_05120 [Candidatus Marinimicrobia bacterium]|nr:hypothetical protein [Candidatus Neomarinimicrobiota bacterium]
MKLDKIRFTNILVKLLLLVFFAVPSQIVYAQDVDEEGEMFWGDDEEEFEDEEEYEDDEEEYEDDEEEYEDDFDSEDVDLADQAENMGWSIDISGSSPRFVNEALMTWNSSINLRASIEAPFLMQVMGMRFRFGAELGTYGFEDSMPPKTSELKGITAMGITSFPVGPGKIKLGIGIIGSSVGSMFESSYGFKFGSIALRVGIRYAKILTPGSDIKESFVVEPENLNWMDGLVAVGISL